jgi:hypothetical protein
MAKDDFITDMDETYLRLRLVKSPFDEVAFCASVCRRTGPGGGVHQSVRDFIVDPSPPAAPLEKTIGYFTSTTVPSVVLGSSSGDGGPGGFYLYQSADDLNGAWTMAVIDPNGDAYERAWPFLFPGNTYPGVTVFALRSARVVHQSAEPGRRPDAAMVR